MQREQRRDGNYRALDYLDDFDGRYFLRSLLAGTKGRQTMRQEEAELLQGVETKAAMLELAFSLRTILAKPGVTNLQHLAEEYALRNPLQPALFGTNNPAVAKLSQREFFVLESWSAEDDPGTPLLWAWFRVRGGFVQYVTISGSNGSLASNAFVRLSAPLDGRIRRYPRK